VANAVEEKRTAYRTWYKSKSDVDHELYRHKRKQARKDVAISKQIKRSEFIADLQMYENPSKTFKVAKGMIKEKQDISGVNCLKDSTGKLIIEEEEVKSTWKKYMEKLMNEENMWDNDVTTERKEGPACKITEREVLNALRMMKQDKAPGLSGISVELLKAVEDLSVEWLTDLCNCIIDEGRMPEDWKNSILIPVYKGKGDPLECGSYTGIKLLEHAMKVVERVLEKRIREQAVIDNTQFGFMPGKGQLMQYSLCDRCRRSIDQRVNVCTWHLWMLRRRLIGYLGRC